MTFKTIIAFIVGVVFIIGSIVQSVKKIKVWKTLTGKQKYDAIMWMIIGGVFSIIIILIALAFLLG